MLSEKLNTKMMEVARKRPTVFIDLWFVIVLPLITWNQYRRENWIGLGMFLLFAGLMFFIRSHVLVRLHKIDSHHHLEAWHFRKLLAGKSVEFHSHLDNRTVQITLDAERAREIVEFEKHTL